MAKEALETAKAVVACLEAGEPEVLLVDKLEQVVGMVGVLAEAGWEASMEGSQGLEAMVELPEEHMERMSRRCPACAVRNKSRARFARFATSALRQQCEQFPCSAAGRQPLQALSLLLSAR